MPTKRYAYKATCIWPLEGIKCHGLTRDLFMKGVTKRHAYKATCIWPLEGIKCHGLTRDLFMKGVTKRHAYKTTCLQSDMHMAPRGHQVTWADKGFVYKSDMPTSDTHIGMSNVTGATHSQPPPRTPPELN